MKYKLESVEGLWPFGNKLPFTKSQFSSMLETVCAAAALIDFVSMDDEEYSDELNEKFGEDKVDEIYEGVYGSSTWFSSKSDVKADMKRVKDISSGKIVAYLKSHKEWSDCVKAGKENAKAMIDQIQEWYPDWK